MPYFENNTAKIYYEDTGRGDPVIATHGLIENTTYWRITGIADKMEKQFRFIPMDMRAHGKTVEKKDPKGYDIETCMQDILALADHLGLEKFHLISHSTGGFISVNLAMTHSSRIGSLVLTDTSSATTFIQDPADNQKFHESFARSFEDNSWETIMENIKKNPFPLFTGVAETKDNQKMWDMAYEIFKIGNRNAIADFVRSFYTNPDPQAEKLRGIQCPTLVVVGEKDQIFIEPSNLMVKEIPDAVLETYPGAGHMIAIERPAELAEKMISFISSHPIC